MKISANKKFILQDFEPEQQKWIAKLTGPLNSFIEQVIQACSQGLTTTDNFKCQRISLNIAVNQTYPIKQSYTLNERPYDVHVGNVYESTGAVPTAPFSVYAVWLGTTLELTMIGLDASKSYTINIIAQV